MPSKWLIYSLFFLLAGCSLLNPDLKTISKVKIGSTEVKVRVSSTVQDLQRGLVGVTRLAWDQGMLFVFPKKDYYSFWMKGMLIPLDIIWLDGQQVIGLSENVQPPDSQTPDSDLPAYRIFKPVDYVLEVPAGFVAK